LILVNRYFFPDRSATSQIHSDIAFNLVGLGRDLHIVTGRKIYAAPEASFPEHEIINDVTPKSGSRFRILNRSNR